MIKKETLRNTNLNPYYWIENILESNKNFYLDKEEIYALMPKDEDNVPLITISSLETALRNMLVCRIIECEMVKGRRYFTIADKRKER